MKKKIISILSTAALVLLVSSMSSCKSTKHTTKEEPMIGGQKDKHGCLPGAGQTWSELQQNCIQVFNVGQRLNPIENKQSAVISAFVILNDDKTKAEIFLPQEDNKILSKKSGSIYENGNYKYDESNSTLYIKNVARYKAEK